MFLGFSYCMLTFKNKFCTLKDLNHTIYALSSGINTAISVFLLYDKSRSFVFQVLMQNKHSTWLITKKRSIYSNSLLVKSYPIHDICNSLKSTTKITKSLIKAWLCIFHLEWVITRKIWWNFTCMAVVL